MSFLNKWDLLNSKISKKLAIKLCDNERSANIVAYGINVLINDIEKIIIFITAFTAMGLIGAFIKAFVIMSILRMWMGGTHRKTLLTCIIQSFAEFMSIILLSKIIDYTIWMQMIVIFIICIVDLVFCPVILSKRGKYKKRKIYLFKTITIVNILILSIIQLNVGINTKTLVMSCEIIQIIDIILAKVARQKGERL